MRNLRRGVVGWTARGLAAVLKRAPRCVLSPLVFVGVGKMLEWTQGRAARAQLAAALANHKLSKAEQRALVRASCRNLAASLVEGTVVSRRGIAGLKVSIDDREARAVIERYEAHHSAGFIGLTGHIGNWELLAHWVATVSQQGGVDVIAKRAPNPHINRIVEGLRTDLRLTTIYQDDPSSRAVRALRGGRILGVVPDQDVKSLSGMFVEFLGKDAYTPLGPARLAVSARVPLIPFFMIRNQERDGGFRVIVHDPIYPDSRLSRGRQVAQLTRAWSDVVAKTIEDHPDQWPWVHNRWKTTAEKLRSRGRPEYSLDGPSAGHRDDPGDGHAHGNAAGNAAGNGDHAEAM